jgi:hypothetical protein
MVAALTIEAVAFRFHERPQTFSLCGVVLALWIIERHRAGHGALWPLVPLCLVVANLHRGVLLVPLIAAAYAASWALRRPVAWRRVGAFGMVALAAGLACLLTPSGTAIVDSSVRLMGESGFREWSPEWFAPTLEHVWRASPATFGLALLVLLGLALRGRDQEPWDWCLLGIGLLVGSRAVRLLPLFSLLVAVPAASGLARATGVWRGSVGKLVGVAAPLVGLLYAVISPLPAPHLGLQAHRYPEAALRFVREQGIRGRVMNDLRFGGYLMYSGYPELQVYVDGRNDIVYPLDFLRTATSVFQQPALFATEHGRWQAEWLLLANQPDVRARAHIDYDPAWRLVFASQPALVYVRSDGVNRQLAQSHGYRILAAHDLQQTLETAIGAGRPKLAEAARDEARRMVREDERSYTAHLALALAYRLSGPSYAPQAVEQLNIARALGWRP